MKKLLVSIMASTLLLSMVTCANQSEPQETVVVTSNTATKTVKTEENVGETEETAEESLDSTVETLSVETLAVETVVDVGEEISQDTLSSGFSDVTTTDWFVSYVEFVTSSTTNYQKTPYMAKGYTSTHFNPYGEATRGMVAEVMKNIYFAEADGYTNPLTTYDTVGYKDNFPDAIGSEFEQDIYFCKYNGMISGYPDGTVGVDDPVTREAFTLMLMKINENHTFNIDIDTSSLKQFSDSGDVSSWAERSMGWCVNNGIMNGSDGNLNPQGSLSRAELAVMVKKYIEKYAFSTIPNR